jgi:small subunit ribosomal protein S10
MKSLKILANSIFTLSYALRKAEKDRWTVLKSVHIYAKHLVTYEVRTYYRFLNFHNLTGSTMDTFLEYIQRNLPEGTAMKATKIELQKIPEHLKQ